MDERIKEEAVEAGVSPANSETATPARSAADTAATTKNLSINELEKLDDLFPVARDFDLHLHPARTRHHHILDIARAALGQGANVTAEGCLDQVGDSFGLLRYPELNFLPVPEDVYIPRAAIELYRLRPGQKLCGKLRLPRDHEKGLVLDDVRHVAKPVLRHRIVTTFHAEAEGIDPDKVIDALLRDIPAPPERAASRLVGAS